jgi:ABC-type lipoprotein export system ATPase subunit
LIGFWQVRDPTGTWYEILKLLYISHYKKIHKISAELFHKRISVLIGDAHTVTRRNEIKYVRNSDGLISQMNLLENVGLVVWQSGFFKS